MEEVLRDTEIDVSAITDVNRGGLGSSQPISLALDTTEAHVTLDGSQIETFTHTPAKGRSVPKNTNSNKFDKSEPPIYKQPTVKVLKMKQSVIDGYDLLPSKEEFSFSNSHQNKMRIASQNKSGLQYQMSFGNK